MALIVQRIFNGETRTGLRLGLEDYVRPMAVGRYWTRLRIGLLHAMSAGDGVTVAACAFSVGVCSSTGAPYGDLTTGHAVVVTNGNSTTGSPYTYNAGSGAPYYGQGVGNQLTRRVGMVNTSVAGPGSAPTIFALGGTLRLQIGIYEFFKNVAGGVNTIGAAWWWNDSGTSGNLYTFDNQSLVEGMEQPWLVSPTVTGTRTDTGVRGTRALAAGGIGANTVTLDESVGALDSLNIAWNKATYPYEIYGIAVARLG